LSIGSWKGSRFQRASFCPRGFFGVSPNLKPVEYDPEGAKTLLEEAGLPDGFRLTIHGPNDRYINDGKIAEAIAQMLTRIGIDTAVETMPKSVYFNRASSGGSDNTPEFSFILVGWGSGTGEASSPLKSLIHTYDKDRGFGLESGALLQSRGGCVDRASACHRRWRRLAVHRPIPAHPQQLRDAPRILAIGLHHHR
jgi:ABC-type transport system substrate-binding protein